MMHDIELSQLSWYSNLSSRLVAECRTYHDVAPTGWHVAIILTLDLSNKELKN